ncbi:MAG: vWA domain-containing protein, partial [Thermoguttaceae bacterium]
MSGTLPIWLERWLGLAPSAGEGTAWRLEIHWPWPSWVTLLAAAAAATLVVAIYLREGRQASRRWRLMLAAMRLGLVALVLSMIAEVELLLDRTGLPTVAVLIDDTRSVTTVDSYPEGLRRALAERLRRAELPHGRDLSRWNLARTLLAENHGALLEELAEDYKLRFYFLTGVRASRRADVPGIVEELRSAEPLGDSTRLGAAVRSVLDEFRGTTPAAIVLVTDGINTEGPSLAETAAYARRRGVPLYFVGLGSDQPVRDLRLSDLRVEDVVFVDDVVDFHFRLTGAGFAGKKVGLVLRKDDRPEVLARVEAAVGPDGQAQEVQLLYRPTQVGRFRYTIDIERPEGGLETPHAPLSRSIQVRQAKIRVLLAQACPSFEYRFLRNMLLRDKTIELHTVLQDADVEYAEEDKAALRGFPVRRDELFSYDVVILGDASPALLGGPILQALADFVDQPGKGGALVLVAGPQFMPRAYRDTPLGAILPFDPATVRYPDPTKPLVDGFVVQPTELGLASPPMQLGDTPEESRA